MFFLETYFLHVFHYGKKKRRICSVDKFWVVKNLAFSFLLIKQVFFYIFSGLWVALKQVTLSILFSTWNVVFNILIFILLFPIFCFLLRKVKKKFSGDTIFYFIQNAICLSFAFSSWFFFSWLEYLTSLHLFFTDKQKKM